MSRFSCYNIGVTHLWRKKSMSEQFINLTIENIDKEHLCCANCQIKNIKREIAVKNELVERTDC